VVKEEKLKAVEDMKKLIEQYSVIAIIDMHKLPSKQLQEIKKQMEKNTIIKVVKKSILLHALKGAQKENVAELETIIPLQPGIAFTQFNAFQFYLTLDKLKSPTFAKDGDVTEEDIVIMPGPTSLMPGPVITELNKVGIVAGVEEGKIAIKKEAKIAKKGDKISKPLASVLRKLKIQPVKVGVNIVGIYDNGKLFKKDILSLVGETYINKMKDAYRNALNLSVSMFYPTKENIKLLLAKAFNNAKALEKLGGSK